MKMFFIGLFVLPVLIYAQNTEAPDWINDSVFVEDGIIFFVGHSAYVEYDRIALRRAESNALKSLIEKIRNNELVELPPIPADAKSRSPFSSSNNNGTIEGTISDISTIEIWKNDIGEFYVLLSCTGIELKKEAPRRKSLEEMDPMELYLYSLELEESTTE
jgi:hypothetical protein